MVVGQNGSNVTFGGHRRGAATHICHAKHELGLLSQVVKYPPLCSGVVLLPLNTSRHGLPCVDSTPHNLSSPHEDARNKEPCASQNAAQKALGCSFHTAGAGSLYRCRHHDRHPCQGALQNGAYTRRHSICGTRKGGKEWRAAERPRQKKCSPHSADDDDLRPMCLGFLRS
jgi:hypothetical protein